MRAQRPRPVLTIAQALAALALGSLLLFVALRLVIRPASRSTPALSEEGRGNPTAQYSMAASTASALQPSPTPTWTPQPSSTPTATTQPTATPTSTPTPVPLPTLAMRVTLGPFIHDYQTWNNCGPAALSIALSYFNVQRTQADIGAILRPHPADKNVSLHELLAYAEQDGVLGQRRVNGDLDLLRRMVSAGVPVLTEGWMYVGEDIGHYRIVSGYDLETGSLLTQDSFIGANLWVTAEDFLLMWEPFFYAYAPLYSAEQEPLVAAILGGDWDDRAMASHALADADEAVLAAPDNAYRWHNLGEAQVLNENFGAAVTAYEESVRLGLPPRFFWYQFNYFVALNAVGQHDRVLELTDPLVAEVESLAEVHIERGHALKSLGRIEEAVESYELALLYAPDREDIRIILEQMTA